MGSSNLFFDLCDLLIREIPPERRFPDCFFEGDTSVIRVVFVVQFGVRGVVFSPSMVKWGVEENKSIFRLVDGIKFRVARGDDCDGSLDYSRTVEVGEKSPFAERGQLINKYGQGRCTVGFDVD